jgi:sporulation protein YlmC with PRC-barrel domain
MDHGEPISYMTLEPGTPVVTSDGEQIGTVKRVLAVVEDDIFDGLIVKTGEGDRFVDAPHVDGIYERAVVLSLTAGEAKQLPKPEPAPAALEVSPDDLVKRSPLEELGHQLRHAWWRIANKY